MPYDRKILHFDADSTTQLNDLTDRCTHAEFELLRQGGCGQGFIQLRDAFTLRETVEINDYIAMEYSAGDRWYFGRVESITEKSPSGVDISLYGLFVELNEVHIGGFSPVNTRAPHLYAKSDYFGIAVDYEDRDRSLQSWDQVSRAEQVVDWIYHQYVKSATNITLGPIEMVDPKIDFETVVFRGEETVAAVIRSLAATLQFASFGVDADQKLFVTQKRTGVLQTFRHGEDCRNLREHIDRSLLFNRIFLTGGNVYFAETIGDFRYLATFRQAGSITQWGEHRVKLYMPWIRRNVDAIQFAREFFRVYSRPTTRYVFKTIGQATLLKPWDGQLALRDTDNSLLMVSAFDRINVQFNHVPTFTISLGPEDIEFAVPVEHQRWEIRDTGGGDLSVQLSSLGTLSGPSASGELSLYSGPLPTSGS